MNHLSIQGMAQPILPGSMIEKGGIFVTGHDPDYHAFKGPNKLGAINMIQHAISYVTHGKLNPRLLLVTDLRDAGSNHSDSRLGLKVAGFSSFDVADYGSNTPGVLNLRNIMFTNYDVIVVASTEGGSLRQDEIDILNNRSSDLNSYVNNGGGVVAFNEAAHYQLDFPGNSSAPYSFIHILDKKSVKSQQLGESESGIRLTKVGETMGLTMSDVNGNYLHSIFSQTGGMSSVDLDSAGRVASLATSANTTTIENMTNAAVRAGEMKLGVVEPTFTAAAYSNAFYKFYSLAAGKCVYVNLTDCWWPNNDTMSFPYTEHTQLLTAKIPHFPSPNNPIPANPRKWTGHFVPPIALAHHLRTQLSSALAQINILTDADLDAGKGNAYDVLILFHEEYVTQREYDNLRHFVLGGGTLLILDGNVFYAEVSYNPAAQTVTLVKGHGWQFDGQAAHRWSNPGNYYRGERWLVENSEWLGSNFWELNYGNLTYQNNPFGYIFGENQFITNSSGIKIILNYDSKVVATRFTGGQDSQQPDWLHNNPLIATYIKHYGQGKVILSGISVFNARGPPDRVKFLNFLDTELLPLALQK